MGNFDTQLGVSQLPKRPTDDLYQLTDPKDVPVTKPNAKAPVGQGGRFAALKNKLAGEKGVTDPAALAASIGRAKFGKAKFQQFAAKGKS